jgi:hypothetical protein
VWGGAGLLMQVGCAEGLVCSQAQLERSWGVSPTP